MKRSVNFNGFQPSHRHINAADLIATLRALGYTDAQIRQTLLEMQKNAADNTTTAAPTDELLEVTK